ncbi:MAG: hypothetical protein ACE5IQ_03120 [Candidatus Methylomirabilales bacterium]
MDPVQHTKPDPARPKGKGFWIGVGLMASSFAVLGFYLVIPFLPVSEKTMVSMLGVGWLVSWGLFFVGTLLVGRDGYLYLKQLVRNWFRRS